LIYVGTIGPDEYLRAFASQVFWFVLLAGISTLMWRAGEKRVVVQGG